MLNFNIVAHSFIRFPRTITAAGKTLPVLLILIRCARNIPRAGRSRMLIYRSGVWYILIARKTSFHGEISRRAGTTSAENRRATDVAAWSGYKSCHLLCLSSVIQIPDSLCSEEFF